MRSLHREGLTALLALLVGSIGPATAAAGGLAFLPPDGCLPADGGPAFYIHAFGWGDSVGANRGSIRLSAGRADALEDLGDGLFRFRFQPPKLSRPDVLRIEGPAGAGRQELPLCPHPAGRIEIEVEPDRLLAGQGQRAFLRIQVTDPLGRPRLGLPLEATTNVGRIESIEELGAGQYRAVYSPPDDPFPQVAIIMVANPSGARLERVAVARVVIPITARVELPGKTAPGTRVQMVVAGRRFGPVPADREGRFSLPILVPPGYGKAEATSIDRVGNRKNRWVNLFLPETNQLGLWAHPRTLPADGRTRSRLLVTLVDPFGSPRDLDAMGPSAGVTVRAERGRVDALRRLETGLFEAYYTPPEQVAGGQDRIAVAFPRGSSQSRAEVTLALLPGPAARVELRAPDLLPADGQTAGSIQVRVLDDRGNPVGRELVELTTEQGTIQGLSEVEPGLHRAGLVVGIRPSSWSCPVRVRVTDRPGGQVQRILLSPASLAPTPGGGFELEVVLADGLGLPVPWVRVTLRTGDHHSECLSDAFGRARFALPTGGQPGPRTSLVEAQGGAIQQSVFWVGDATTARLLPIGLEDALPPAAALTAEAVVRLHPPAPVVVTMALGQPKTGTEFWRVTVWVASAGGRPLSGRKLQLSCSSGSMGQPREVSAGEYQADWRPAEPGWKEALLSALDQGHQVAAVVKALEGQVGP